MCETKVKINTSKQLLDKSKERKKMKKIQYILGITLIIAVYSCTSTYNAGNNAADDVYYSSKNQSAPTPSSEPLSNSSDNYNTNYNYNQNDSGQPQQSDNSQNQNYSTSEQHSDEKGNTYVTNNYNGDYYDYEYSSKIRRFYQPAYGYNYYDPYYTNSYWYDYNPYSWGVSIYLGYNWWAPSAFYYDPFCYGGFSVGIGYGYGYYGGYPYYPYAPYYPYGGPYYGNNYGYYNGYYAGNCNPYYYNSYDNNSFYYGPRGSVSSNSPRSSSQRQSSITPLGVKYEDAVSSGRISKTRSDYINKSEIPTRDIRNANGGKIIPLNSRENSDIKRQSSFDMSNTGRQNTDIKDNSAIKPSINRDTRISTGNESNIPSNSARNNNEIKNSNTGNKPANENQTEIRKNIKDQNTGDTKISKDRYYSNPNPLINERNSNEIKSQNRSNSIQENRQSNTDRQLLNTAEPKIDRSPKIEKQYFQRQEPQITTPSRQEKRTPIFQPRDEPKQFRQESVPTPQHTQPSQPSRPSQNNGGGGRRK